MTRLISRFTARIRTAFLPSAETAAGRSFEEFCEERLYAHGGTVAFAMLGIALLWWPVDYLIFGRLPSAIAPYAQWRVSVACSCVVYLLVARLPAMRPHLWKWALGLMSLGCGLVGYSQVPLGGPETPWFHLMYVMPALTLVLPLPLGTRVAGTALLAASGIGGYLLPEPSYLDSPYVPLMLSFLASTTLLSIGFGHAIQVLLRANFEQARVLDARVSERTRELQRLLTVLETAREDERRRVAQDLHDELGQELTALRYALGYTRHRYEQEPQAMAKNFEELDRLLDRTGAATRDLIMAMRPRVLDDLGLTAAAEWLCRSTESRTGIPCHFEAMGDTQAALPTDLSTAAFRILQESITNAVRHADPSTIRVTLRQEGAALDLRVVDDGCGIIPGPRAGFGLSGMTERAAALGGHVTVLARAEGGTEVHARLPLERP